MKQLKKQILDINLLLSDINLRQVDKKNLRTLLNIYVGKALELKSKRLEKIKN